MEGIMTEYSADYLARNLPSSSLEYSAPKCQRGFSPSPSPDNPAKSTYERLTQYINGFEKTCADDQEVGVRLFSHNTSITLHLRDMSYYGSDILCFNGLNEPGEELQLIQNVSQLSVLLVPLKRHGEKPFRLRHKLQRAAEE